MPIVPIGRRVWYSRPSATVPDDWRRGEITRIGGSSRRGHLYTVRDDANKSCASFNSPSSSSSVTTVETILDHPHVKLHAELAIAVWAHTTDVRRR